MTERRTLIVTPTYNERENLEKLVEGIRENAPHAHLLVVDDGSPDGTGDLAEKLGRGDERIRLLRRPGKMGLASAYLDGFKLALEQGYEVVMEMDADLSHDPRHLPAMLGALDRADVAIGSRGVPGGGVEGWGPMRHFISKGGSLYSRLILGMPVRDMTTGFKAWKAGVLRAMPLDEVKSEGYAFQIELNYRALRLGFRIEEVPIIFVDRRAGQSKMSSHIFAEAMWMMWRLRLDALRGRL
ncbi:MAG: polyprenol monophosphomannose synthase [Deltaproteobacteria bacterium]|nr:polyprenol monophosphomannose synthase [Deltaproteobacteria bacterium]